MRTHEEVTCYEEIFKKWFLCPQQQQQQQQQQHQWPLLMALMTMKTVQILTTFILPSSSINSFAIKQAQKSKIR